MEKTKEAIAVENIANILMVTIFLKNVEALKEKPAWNIIGGNKNKKNV